jgi:riboflavin kinase/FMN adenylyltransferase
VLTFEPHPLEVLSPERAPRRLTTPDDRAELLAAFGVGRLVEHPFDRRLASIEPGAFVDEFVSGRLGARCVVVGRGFRFGKDRAGDEEALARMGAKRGFDVVVVPEREMAGEVVSSSRLRLLIARDADVAGAARLLGRPHRVHGLVVRGKGRGRTLGFPTANLEGICELIPAQGVYACAARLGGRSSPAAVHVGPRLTFDDESTVEAYVVGHDHSRDLYDERMALDFVEHLREPRRVDDRDALVEQIREDVRRTVEIVEAP